MPKEKKLHQYEITFTVRIGKSFPGIEAKTKAEAIKLAREEFEKFIDDLALLFKHSGEGEFVRDSSIKLDAVEED